MSAHISNERPAPDQVLTEIADYLLGHRRRRSEGLPLLEAKFKTNLARRFKAEQQAAILQTSLDQRKLDAMPVNAYLDLYAV